MEGFHIYLKENVFHNDSQVKWLYREKPREEQQFFND